MSYAALDVIRALRDLGRDDAGGLSIQRWSEGGGGETDDGAEALFRELLVEQFEGYSTEELAEAFCADMRASGCFG